ncbi:hypothetical protein FKM82_020154 [Ascaphus truei]
MHQLYTSVLEGQRSLTHFGGLVPVDIGEVMCHGAPQHFGVNPTGVWTRCWGHSHSVGGTVKGHDPTRPELFCIIISHICSVNLLYHTRVYFLLSCTGLAHTEGSDTGVGTVNQQIMYTPGSGLL